MIEFQFRPSEITLWLIMPTMKPLSFMAWKCTIENLSVYGKKTVFGSNWRQNVAANKSLDTYLIELPYKSLAGRLKLCLPGANT